MSVGQPDEQYTIGVDYGTLSGRAVVVRVSDGAEVGSAVHPYPHAVVDEVLPGTGAALPAGADAVVIQEDASEPSGDRVELQARCRFRYEKHGTDGEIDIVGRQQIGQCRCRARICMHETGALAAQYLDDCCLVPRRKVIRR